MDKKYCISIFFIAALMATSCMTTRLVNEPIPTERVSEGNAKTREEEEKAIEREDEKHLVELLEKEVDVAKTVVYVEKPVYRPAEAKNDPLARENVQKGLPAAKAAIDGALRMPEKYSGAKMLYDYDERFVYEIYCKPYHITDIELEPGEEVWEAPFVSEPDVWQIGAGVSKKGGVDIQHFFLKPSYSKLASNMIIITNRRIYHLQLRSYKDDYMAMVQWNYPPSMPYVMAKSENAVNSVKSVLSGTSPEFLSFDYKIKYSPFKKPAFIPIRIYDDGAKTYIEVDDEVLHGQLPALFAEDKNIINYRVKGNLFIIDQLITKATLRLNKEKVIIEKLKSKSK